MPRPTTLMIANCQQAPPAERRISARNLPKWQPALCSLRPRDRSGGSAQTLLGNDAVGAHLAAQDADKNFDRVRSRAVVLAMGIFSVNSVRETMRRRGASDIRELCTDTP